MYILILLLIIFVASMSNRESFHNFMPYFGIATRYTRGMTYDMRCLPHIKKQYIPWGYGTMYPNHYGKCLEMN